MELIERYRQLGEEIHALDLNIEERKLFQKIISLFFNGLELFVNVFWRVSSIMVLK